MFTQSGAFSFQIATDDQAETDRYWTRSWGSGGQESACDWCKHRWGLSWRITPGCGSACPTAEGMPGKVAERG